LLPILCLWANLHGSVTLGATVVAGYGLLASLRTRRRLPLVLCMAPLNVFASPYALELPRYYRTMLLNPPFAGAIVEWNRTTPMNAPTFFVVAALVAVVVWRRRRMVLPVEWLLLTLTGAAALTATRLTPWFGLTALAILPPLTTRRLGPTPAGRPAAWITTALGLLIAGALVSVGRHDYRQAPQTSGDLSPVVAALRLQPPTARVLSDLQFADWVLWQAPKLRGHVAYDARPEVLTRQQFVDDVLPFERMTTGWRTAVQPYTLVVTTNASRARMHGWRTVAADGDLVLLHRG
jgi:hypothetical protein